MNRLPTVWIAATASVHAFPTSTCHSLSGVLSACRSSFFAFSTSLIYWRALWDVVRVGEWQIDFHCQLSFFPSTECRHLFTHRTAGWINQLICSIWSFDSGVTFQVRTTRFHIPEDHQILYHVYRVFHDLWTLLQ